MVLIEVELKGSRSRNCVGEMELRLVLLLQQPQNEKGRLSHAHARWLWAMSVVIQHDWFRVFGLSLYKHGSTAVATRRAQEKWREEHKQSSRAAAKTATTSKQPCYILR